MLLPKLFQLKLFQPVGLLGKTLANYGNGGPIVRVAEKGVTLNPSCPSNEPHTAQHSAWASKLQNPWNINNTHSFSPKPSQVSTPPPSNHPTSSTTHPATKHTPLTQ